MVACDGLVLATGHLAVHCGVIRQSFSTRVFRRRTCRRLACRCAGRIASTGAEKGLWSHATVWFSQLGTLPSTAESFVNRSPRGYFADELAGALHVDVQDALHQLAQQRRITRQMVSGLYLYTAIDRTIQQGQLLTRRNVDSVPTVADASVLEVSEEELKASILLFYSLLDEQQRRLYAGLESLKLGRGGDRSLADFLDLDPHTVARGRQQLLAQDVEVDRARKAGGGRRPVEKKRPK